jgi:hypothetical protein
MAWTDPEADVLYLSAHRRRTLNDCSSQAGVWRVDEHSAILWG